ncbi:hypothetical protein FACS1894141_2830 [Spirochaetia bacterium]|nr:hypothetical protein FACS1894141_2830 [Spirochaetia bacterium]
MKKNVFVIMRMLYENSYKRSLRIKKGNGGGCSYLEGFFSEEQVPLQPGTPALANKERI